MNYSQLMINDAALLCFLEHFKTRLGFETAESRSIGSFCTRYIQIFLQFLETLLSSSDFHQVMGGVSNFGGEFQVFLHPMSKYEA